jgi:hypothetical protein
MKIAVQKALEIWERLNDRRQICSDAPLRTLESKAQDMIRTSGRTFLPWPGIRLSN